MRSLLIAILFINPFSALGETVIPIDIQQGNPVATALIGDQTVRLVVDSGGYSLGLRAGVVAGIDIDRSREMTNTTDVHGVSKKSLSFTIPNFEIGGSVHSEVPAYEWDLPEPVAQRFPAIDGILGRDFLNQFVVIYDYDNATITLLDNSEDIARDCTGEQLALIEHSDEIIVTETIVEHGKLRVIWDTGASHSFLKEHVADRREFPLEADENIAGFYNSDKLMLGGSDFGPIDFAVLPYVEPKNVDAFFGWNVFSKHVVCINSSAGWLRIRPN